MIFETERLIVRPWTLEDIDDGFMIYGDPDVMRYLGAGNNAPETVEAFLPRLEGIINRNILCPTGMGLWALELKESGTVIGSVILKPLPESEKIEVGWHIRQDHWGQGLAAEAGAGAIAYGFEKLGLQTIYAIMYPENVRSRRVAEKCGLTSIGRTIEFHGLELDLLKIDRAN